MILSFGHFQKKNNSQVSKVLTSSNGQARLPQTPPVWWSHYQRLPRVQIVALGFPKNHQHEDLWRSNRFTNIILRKILYWFALMYSVFSRGITQCLVQCLRLRSRMLRGKSDIIHMLLENLNLSNTFTASLPAAKAWMPNCWLQCCYEDLDKRYSRYWLRIAH